HLSGVGVPRAGDLPFMPGPPGPAGFSHSSEAAAPGYYRVALASGVTVELTASTRTAMQRYTFGPGVPRAMTVDARTSVAGPRRGEVRRTGRAELSGWTRGTYPVYFVGRFSIPILSFH